jgi:outer membrane protein
MVLVMAGTFLPAVAVAAESQKVAVVITAKLLSQSEAGKQAAAKLQEKKKVAQERLDAKAKEIKDLQEDLAKRAMVLSEDQRVKAREDFDRQQRDAQRMKEDLERELQKLESEVLGGVNKLLTQVIVDYGKQNQYDAIIDATATLYFSDATDVTDELIKAADAVYKKRE